MMFWSRLLGCAVLMIGTPFHMAHGKKLTNAAMELLNRSMEHKAHVMVRLEISKRRAIDIMNHADKLRKIPAHGAESEVIQAHIKEILEMVEEFFSQIRINASLLRPLISESLHELDHEFCSDQILQDGQPAFRYIFEEFFDAPDADVFDYLRRKVTSSAALYQFCREFVTFSQDMYDSCSAPVAQKRDHIFSKIQGQQGALSKKHPKL